jgi:hypothetical protein
VSAPAIGGATIMRALANFAAAPKGGIGTAPATEPPPP